MHRRHKNTDTTHISKTQGLGPKKDTRCCPQTPKHESKLMQTRTIATITHQNWKQKDKIWNVDIYIILCGNNIVFEYKYVKKYSNS